MDVRKARSELEENGKGGMDRIEEYELALSEEEFQNLSFISYSYGSVVNVEEPMKRLIQEPMKRLIQEEMGERPKGDIYSLTVEEPETKIIHLIDSREKEEVPLSEYIVSVEFKVREEAFIDEIQEEIEKVRTNKLYGDVFSGNMTMSMSQDEWQALRSKAGLIEGEDVGADGLVDELENEPTHPNSKCMADSWVDNVKEECPECGEEFSKNERVEGDDGTPFCSLSCLNKWVK